MITTDRDVFLGVHLTLETKESLRKEAERRKVSMSFLVSSIIEDWLVVAPSEQVEPIRSSKRIKETKEIDVPLPLEN